MAVRVMVEWTGLATRGPAAGSTAAFPAADQETSDDTGRGRRDGANEDAPNGQPVVLYRIEGGGHGSPGAAQYPPSRLLGRVPRDLDATGILLSFARALAERNDPRPKAPASDRRS